MATFSKGVLSPHSLPRKSRVAATRKNYKAILSLNMIWQAITTAPRVSPTLNLVTPNVVDCPTVHLVCLLRVTLGGFIEYMTRKFWLHTLSERRKHRELQDWELGTLLTHHPLQKPSSLIGCTPSPHPVNDTLNSFPIHNKSLWIFSNLLEIEKGI